MVGLLAATVAYVSPSRPSGGELAQYQATLKCSNGEKLLVVLEAHSFYNAWEAADQHRPDCRVRRVMAHEPGSIATAAPAAGGVSAH